jgi:hypothetical protein
VKPAHILLTTAACLTMYAGTLAAQAPDGPQTDAPLAPAALKTTRPQPGSGEQIIVPSGTRIGVTLENGISTATAKPGDSVYFRTSFPVTMNNKVVLPIGSYLRV